MNIQKWQKDSGCDYDNMYNPGQYMIILYDGLLWVPCSSFFAMDNGRYTGVISIRIKILFLFSDIEGKGFCASIFPQHFIDIL